METNYERAEIEIINFNKDDIITTSLENNTNELPMVSFPSSNKKKIQTEGHRNDSPSVFLYNYLPTQK